MAEFLNKSPTEEQLIKIMEHLKFDVMANNESINKESAKKVGAMNPDGKFIRKGTYIIRQLNILYLNCII